MELVLWAGLVIYKSSAVAVRKGHSQSLGSHIQPAVSTKVFRWSVASKATGFYCCLTCNESRWLGPLLSLQLAWLQRRFLLLADFPCALLSCCKSWKTCTDWPKCCRATGCISAQLRRGLLSVCKYFFWNWNDLLSMFSPSMPLCFTTILKSMLHFLSERWTKQSQTRRHNILVAWVAVALPHQKHHDWPVGGGACRSMTFMSPFPEAAYESGVPHCPHQWLAQQSARHLPQQWMEQHSLLLGICFQNSVCAAKNNGDYSNYNSCQVGVG